MGTSHKNIVKNSQALGVRGIENVVQAKASVINTVNRWNQTKQVYKKISVVTCQKASASSMQPREQISQRHVTVLESSINSLQLYWFPD